MIPRLRSVDYRVARMHIAWCPRVPRRTGKDGLVKGYHGLLHGPLRSLLWAAIAPVPCAEDTDHGDWYNSSARGQACRMSGKIYGPSQPCEPWSKVRDRRLHRYSNQDSSVIPEGQKECPLYVALGFRSSLVRSFHCGMGPASVVFIIPPFKFQTWQKAAKAFYLDHAPLLSKHPHPQRRIRRLEFKFDVGTRRPCFLSGSSVALAASDSRTSLLFLEVHGTW